MRSRKEYKALRESKRECERKATINTMLVQEVNRLKNENESLKMKFGFYRNAARQGVNITGGLVEEIPESWEPNVTY